MATATSALPQLDMSTSVPLSTPAPSALPKLDMSTSVPLGAQSSGATGGSASNTVPGALGIPTPPPPEPVAPPQDHKEEVVRTIAGDAGLSWYRYGRGVVGQVEQLLEPPKKGDPSQFYEKGKDLVKKAIASVPKTAAANWTPDFSNRPVSERPLYAQPIAPAPGVVSALKTAAPDLAAGGAQLVNPFRRVAAAVASPAAAGEAAAQPIAQAGIAKVAPTVGASLRSGIDVQTPLADAKAIYQTVDDAAKTDFKALYDKLDAAQDAAREAAIGSPEEAKAQLNIKNTQDAIDDAKSVAKASGVPDVDAKLKQADAKFMETQANKDFNSKFFGKVVRGNVAHGAGETIDVQKAIDTLEDMDKPNKYGPSRLQQTSLGKKGAFELKQYLYDAQKAGTKALDSRQLRNNILKWTIPGAGAVIGAAYELTK